MTFLVISDLILGEIRHDISCGSSASRQSACNAKSYLVIIVKWLFIVPLLLLLTDFLMMWLI